MTANRLRGGAAAVGLLGIVGSIGGAIVEPDAFFRAWLCSYLFWLGIPLAGVTLVLVHDLSGGNWMGTARPVLGASIVTMPLASLAGIPAFIGFASLYDWTHPQADLSNLFYLNTPDFFIRYACYVAIWNLLAAFALLGPREGRLPIRPGLSWLSALGLIALAFSSSFAAIDWVLSLEPKFWSSIFPYTQAAAWFNTGAAAVLLVIALAGWPSAERRAHMADLSQILLATVIFWAYVEFMQFLIIWEGNLRSEIHWYIVRLKSAWQPAIYVSVGLGFAVPFFVLLWGPPKRSRAAVGTVCASILLARVANTWWLVPPEFERPTPLWLLVTALMALGGAMLLLFMWALPRRHRLPARAQAWSTDHA